MVIFTLLEKRGLLTAAQLQWNGTSSAPVLETVKTAYNIVKPLITIISMIAAIHCDQNGCGNSLLFPKESDFTFMQGGGTKGKINNSDVQRIVLLRYVRPVKLAIIHQIFNLIDSISIETSIALKNTCPLDDFEIPVSLRTSMAERVDWWTETWGWIWASGPCPWMKSNDISSARVPAPPCSASQSSNGRRCTSAYSLTCSSLSRQTCTCGGGQPPLPRTRILFNMQHDYYSRLYQMSFARSLKLLIFCCVYFSSIKFQLNWLAGFNFLLLKCSFKHFRTHIFIFSAYLRFGSLLNWQCRALQCLSVPVKHVSMSLLSQWIAKEPFKSSLCFLRVHQ